MGAIVSESGRSTDHSHDSATHHKKQGVKSELA